MTRALRGGSLIWRRVKRDTHITMPSMGKQKIQPLTKRRAIHWRGPVGHLYGGLLLTLFYQDKNKTRRGRGLVPHVHK